MSQIIFVVSFKKFRLRLSDRAIEIERGSILANKNKFYTLKRSLRSQKDTHKYLNNCAFGLRRINRKIVEEEQG